MKKLLSLALFALPVAGAACTTETVVNKTPAATESTPTDPAAPTDGTTPPDEATPAADPCACPSTCASTTEKDKTAVCKPRW